MTHDELLAKIDHTISNHIGVPSMYKALRAVVELHRLDEWSMCVGCHKLIKWENCPTIQAIQKELS